MFYIYLLSRIVVTCSNSVEATKLLLDGGADMNIGDERGVVPLAMAAALGHAGIVNLLLGHSRTDPNIPVRPTPSYTYICSKQAST